jgi:hypothetical protein
MASNKTYYLINDSSDDVDEIDEPEIALKYNYICHQNAD